MAVPWSLWQFGLGASIFQHSSRGCLGVGSFVEASWIGRTSGVGRPGPVRNIEEDWTECTPFGLYTPGSGREPRSPTTVMPPWDRERDRERVRSQRDRSDVRPTKTSVQKIHDFIHSKTTFLPSSRTITFHFSLFNYYTPASSISAPQRLRICRTERTNDHRLHVTGFHRPRLLGARQLLGHRHASLPDGGTEWGVRGGGRVDWR